MGSFEEFLAEAKKTALRPKEVARRLFEAAFDNDAAKVKKIIRTGVSPDVRDELGRTPLHAAASNCGYETVALLIKLGADVNAKDEDRWTPLHVRAQSVIDEDDDASDNVTLLLISKGAEVDAVCDEGTPLEMAAAAQNLEVMKNLIKNGARVSTGLLSARFTDEVNDFLREEVRKKMSATDLPREAASERPDRRKLDADLFAAIADGDLKGLLAALAAGADPNARDSNDRTTLHVAASRDRCSCLEALLKNGADPNAKDNDGWTALYCAAENDATPCVEALLRARADPEARNKNGGTPLHVATSPIRVSCVEALLKGGADPNARNDRGETALHLLVRYSVYSGQTKIRIGLRTLLKNGADPFLRDAEGRMVIDLVRDPETREVLASAIREKMSATDLPKETRSLSR